MSIFELMVIGAFAVMAGYLMWIHYHLINRNFAHDFFYSINKAIAPAMNGLQDFLNASASELTEQHIKFNEQHKNLIEELREQRALVQEQTRLIKQQSDSFVQYTESYESRVTSLKNEIVSLKNSLSRAQSMLDKSKKKAAKEDGDKGTDDVKAKEPLL
jgi:phage host-nuclease inhibitor protein Gam